MIKLGVCSLLPLLASLLLLQFSEGGNQRWQFGSLTPSKSCSYSYKASRREGYQTTQYDQIVLWLGNPSQSLLVKGKHGFVPLPTMWASFAHIIYFNCKDGHEYSPSIREWFTQHPDLQDRDVVLAGNDAQQSFRLLNIAEELLDKPVDEPQLRLKTVFYHSSSYLPHALFFGHKSFETWNDMNFWTFNRANQSVACNTKLPAVEFFLNDVKLTYRRREDTDKDHQEMFEYYLSEISTWDTCHDDIEVFAKEYSQRPALSSETVPPALSSDIHTAFPSCASKHTTQNQVETLLSRNVSVVLYSLIPHAAEIICSFYIGIYVSDALYLPPSNDAIARFNAASTETMPSSWSATGSRGVEASESSLGEMSPGQFQQADGHPSHSCSDDHSEETQPSNLGIMFLRSDKTNSKSREDRVQLSKQGAIAVFEQLLQDSSAHQANTVDIVDLISMDAIDELDY